MGFWSSVGSALSKACSAAVGIVSSAVKAVGGLVVSAAEKFLSLPLSKLEIVVNILEGIARVLGIIGPQDDVEDLGDRAMRADKKPEDFDSIQDYIQYLKEEIDSNRKALNEMSLEERLARRAIGAGLLSMSIAEKKSLQDISFDFWSQAAQLGLSEKGIDGLLDSLKKYDLNDRDFIAYSERRLEPEKEEQIEQALLDLYRSLYPNVEQTAIEERIMDLQRKVNNKDAPTN